jgi:hypothetical protein
VRKEMIDPFYEQTEVLAREDIADDVAYMVTPPRATAASASYGPCPQNSSDRIRAPGAFSSTVAHQVATETDACG